MSGGLWNYNDSILTTSIFGWDTDTPEKAAKANPLEDRIMSELVYDALQVLHEYDWYHCGDTSEADYRKAVAAFKKKWLKASALDLSERVLRDCIADMTDDICKTLFI